MTTVLFIFFSYAGFSQKDCDYNPYQHQREEYIETINEIYQEDKDIDCELAEEWIQKGEEEYKSDLSEDSKIKILGKIAKINCPRAMRFFMNVILNDTSVNIREPAIGALSWFSSKEIIPFLKSYYKEELPQIEKLSIALVLCRLKEYDLAVNFLNSFCYDTNGFIKDECIQVYEFAGKTEIARKYYEHYFESADEEHLLFAATKLAEYGNYEKAYPILVKSLNDDNQSNIVSALYGLATIGDEESMNLIRERTKSDNEFIAKKAKWIFQYIEMKRREKCKE
jgi:HEAT repeat protein